MDLESFHYPVFSYQIKDPERLVFAVRDRISCSLHFFSIYSVTFTWRIQNQQEKNGELDDRLMVTPLYRIQLEFPIRVFLNE